MLSMNQVWKPYMYSQMVFSTSSPIWMTGLLVYLRIEDGREDGMRSQLKAKIEGRKKSGTWRWES